MKLEYIFKYIIIGNAGTGKTSIAQSFVNLKNPYPQSTVGVGFYNKKIKLSDDHNIKIHVWDTAGLERFFSITQSYFKQTTVVIIAYDVTSKNSFNNVKYWFNSVKKYCDSDTVIVIVGNKIDSEYCKIIDSNSIKISVKNKVNIDKLLEFIDYILE